MYMLSEGQDGGMDQEDSPQGDSAPLLFTPGF